MYIVANWKAYIDRKEDAQKLLAIAKRHSKPRTRIIVAPSFAHLGFLLRGGNRSGVRFAAQDISSTTVGSATGEMHGSALRNMGVGYVIVGHSERRAQGEDNALVSAKIKQALMSGLIPILCIGEKERDVDATYLSFLKQQLHTVFAELTPRERRGVMIAYEPIWAIGKHAHDAMSPENLTEMVLYIRKVLSEFLPGKLAEKTLILYGGSVEPDNAQELAKNAPIDGFLVGHASADPVMFTKLMKALA